LADADDEDVATMGKSTGSTAFRDGMTVGE